MIASIRHKGLKRFYDQGDRSGLSAAMLPRISRILSVLEVAEVIEQIDIPGYRLHSLTGNRLGFWSVRVIGNWRIIFRFVDGAVLDVDLVDYH